MAIELEGFHRKLYLTRYAKKSMDKSQFIVVGADVVTLVKDGKYPVREIATVKAVEGEKVIMTLQTADGFEYQVGDEFVQDINLVDALVETKFEQTADRVAGALASVEPSETKEAFYKKAKKAIENFHLVPSGRILTGAGDDSQVTLFNCYVIDVELAPYAKEKGRDSRQAIFHHMGRISEIMARGGGVGTNLSVFRPRYSGLSKTKGQSTGAIFIGNQFSGLTEFINQANRRGAQMLTLHDWHPDVFYTNDINSPDYNEDFIGAKRKQGFMEGNNSSILVSDAFMFAVEHDLDWNLVFPDTSHSSYDKDWDGDLDKWIKKHGKDSVKVHRTVKAKEMWNKIMVSNHTSAEPGIIYIDEVERNHNGHYLGVVKATNPCGEQPILGNSTCNLSAVNFGRMIKVSGTDELGNLYEIDWDLLKETIHTGVRFLDNAIDLTYYFDKDMKKWQQGERRVGLGGMGVADLAIALRVRYGSPEFNAMFDQLMAFLRDESYRASVELAKEKGSFPLFKKTKFMQSGFVKRLPKDIQNDIKKFGIRNLTLNTFAPTGTTGSMTPSLLDINGSVSTGIEPHFAMKYDRLSRIGKTVQYAGVAKAFMDSNPTVNELPSYFVGAMDLTPEEHVMVQAVAQKYIDSSISKTVNAPANYTVEQCEAVYMNLYKSGCKGGTIYRQDSRDEQILTLSTDTETTVEVEVKDETGTNTGTKVKGKYDDWTCGNCGSEEFHMVEGCPQCDNCGSQSCSI
ncbi:ribonucleoside-diphosphate reductase alpha chain [Neobacillus niacini]|uniref:adenosylcobalamin-dependent ribonucleoside-diphosphate reductase n=1 Tax=Neobacillus driksii TaxID=3035913 RepID=UPI00278AB7DB|nr:adenosylcobalamin-dependent ribonucleoside-diphosphate reductase [Neobacillus niacini]MDQ0976671.1 ribonucleoside-diphosphate reductase alpha chain [Neobacillus niacini]